MCLGITYRIWKFFNLKSAKEYYFAFIYSRITYGISVWGGGPLLASAYHGSIESIQDRIVGLLFFKYCNTPLPNVIYRNMGLLKIVDIYKYVICTIIYTCINCGNVPFIYSNLCKLYFLHHYDTRHVDNLIIPYHRTNATKFNFLYRAVKEWNSLPSDLRKAKSLREFKIVLRKLFWIHMQLRFSGCAYYFHNSIIIDL